MRLKGTLNYDLAQVTPLLRPYVGNGVQLTGREQARFVLAGKLNGGTGPRASAKPRMPRIRMQLQSAAAPAVHWSRRVRAQLELPWSGANLYGLPGRRRSPRRHPGRRLAATRTINLAVGEGQLTAAPNIRFDPEPSELTMPPGPLLTNVRISPEVSEAMLKFVAAGARRCDAKRRSVLVATRRRCACRSANRAAPIRRAS